MFNSKKRELKRLGPATLQRLPAGMHADGNGLYLSVQESGSRSWILRTMIRGRRKDIGLGGLSTTSLAEAREEAAKLRGQARKGEDILEGRRMEKRKQNVPTFEAMARTVYGALAETQGNRDDWLRSLELHVFPVFGRKTVDIVDSADVLRAIAPIWTKTTEMARKTLGRISKVMDRATVEGHRTVMAGHIAVPLPNPCAGVTRGLPAQPMGRHHTALPYSDLPAFIVKLNTSHLEPSVKLALEFSILTVMRTSTALYARKDELDIDNKVWIVPLERLGEGAGRRGMKKIRGGETEEREPFKVPLSARCLEIVKLAEAFNRNSELVFPGNDGAGHYGTKMLKGVQSLEGCENLTVHGFRSSFKTWCHEKTKYDFLVIEACQGHKVQGIERHYLRTTFFEQRRKVMEDWARFVAAGSPAKVVKIR